MFNVCIQSTQIIYFMRGLYFYFFKEVLKHILLNIYHFSTNLVQVMCFSLTCRRSKELTMPQCTQALRVLTISKKRAASPRGETSGPAAECFPSGRSDDPCIIQMRSGLDLWHRAHSSNVRPLRAHWPGRLEWCVQSLFCRGGCMRRCAQPMRTDRRRRDEFYGATWKNECTEQERRFWTCLFMWLKHKERQRCRDCWILWVKNFLRWDLI